MEPIDPRKPEVEARYRTMITLWFALVISVVLYLIIVSVMRLGASADPSNPRLGLLLLLFSLVPMTLSFLAKQVMLAKAIERQEIAGVQTAYVVAWALCEMPALLGMVIHFAAGSTHFYFAFLIAGLGMLLHFPLKKHLLAASGQEF